jgi:hypothetical protein
MPNACGCGRGFAGVASHRATTTAKVIDLPELNLAGYESAIAKSLADGGWPPAAAQGIAQAMSEMAAEWEVGTVLERDIWLLTARRGGAVEEGPLVSIDEYLGSFLPERMAAAVRDRMRAQIRPENPDVQRG